MKRIILTIAILINTTIIFCCSCEYIDGFCHSADTSDYIALVELFDFEDATAAYFKLIDNINKEIPDTIHVLGQDGLNCNFGLSDFFLGDTLVVNFSKYNTSSQNAFNGNYYDWGIGGCRLNHLRYSKGKVMGYIKEPNEEVEYLDFKSDISGCFDFILNSKEQFLEEITVYPNPSADKFYISSGQNLRIDFKVFDLKGYTINQTTQENQRNLEVDLNSVNPGIYILEIRTEKGILRKKILKL